MDVEANKALVRRFYEEVWARRNVAFTQEVFADDYARHDLRPTTAPPGAAGQALIAERFRRAFPDLQWRVDLVLGDGDLVAARWTAAGTHSGGWGDIAPTGRRATFSGVNIFRFGDEESGGDLEPPRRLRTEGTAWRGGVRRSAPSSGRAPQRLTG